MADYYLGQIMLTGFNYAPRGFLACDGQIMQINQFQALYALLGTQYGGNGTSTFALPDLRGTTPIHPGTSIDSAGNSTTYVQGQKAGAEGVTLIPTQLAAHNHLANASSEIGTAKTGLGAFYGNSGTTESIYAQSSGAQVVMDPQTIANTGGNGSHDNMQPFQVLNFSICVAGIFPSRN